MVVPTWVAVYCSTWPRKIGIRNEPPKMLAPAMKLITTPRVNSLFANGASETIGCR